jgi:hypothetical protein
MDTQAQMQAIIDKLAGAPQKTQPPLYAFDEPWRTIYRRVKRAWHQTEAELLIWQATQGLEVHHLARDLIDRLPEDDAFATYRSLHELPTDDAFTAYPSLHEVSGQFPPVAWLWPSWIPRGLLTLLGAAPGMGKSLVALDLARRIIHGEPFPDGAPVPCPGSNVLIVDAEGSPGLLNQRAEAWALDRRRLFLMPVPDSGELIDLADQHQQHLLLKMCCDLRPTLIIVDSLAAATTRGETSLEGARALLGFLSTVAHRAHVALLVIHHLRKRASSGRAGPASRVVADDLRGSSHISAAARSVLALSPIGNASAFPASPKDAFASPEEVPPGGGTAPAPPEEILAPAEAAFASPEEVLPLAGAASAPALFSTHHRPDLAGPRRLEVVKANLCLLPPPLGLFFEGENLPVPTLRYAPLVEPAPQVSHVELCTRWLLQHLAGAGAPLKPADVVRAAEEAGFPRATLYRARKALAGLVVDLGNSPRDPGKRWTLATPPQEGPPLDSDTVIQ